MQFVMPFNYDVGRPIQTFQAITKYARYLHDAGRREMWTESVDRAVAYLKKLDGGRLNLKQLGFDYNDLRESILNLEVFPSMRLIAMAGPALDRSHIGLYNCSYDVIDSTRAFGEALYILMHGSGYGFSVESRHTKQLPKVMYQYGHTLKETVKDSTEGWKRAVDVGVTCWFNGMDVEFDISRLRPAGTVLMTKGGRASGPAPLLKTLSKVKSLILGAQGRQLTPLEVHDIICTLADCVMVGGVRRTALISISDLWDTEMRNAKSAPKWWEDERMGVRKNANNSQAWPIDRPLTYEEVVEFMQAVLWGNGEPSIFNRRAALLNMSDERKGRLTEKQLRNIGMNPCGEALLVAMSKCNLTNGVITPNDNSTSMIRKVSMAAMIGTLQASAINFPGLRPEWEANCKNEALLGVSIAGVYDNDKVMNPAILHSMQHAVHAVNRLCAHQLGINTAAASTGIKPSGNTSVLAGCSPGANPYLYQYGIRRVGVHKDDPVAKLFMYHNAPMEVSKRNKEMLLIEFPDKAPDGAITLDDVTAIQQLDNLLMLRKNYCDQNVSATVVYEPQEKDDIVDWVYQHQDDVIGIAFLQRIGHGYPQLPYEATSKDEYRHRLVNFPHIDYNRLPDYELDDMTTSAQELACMSGECVQQGVNYDYFHFH